MIDNPRDFRLDDDDDDDDEDEDEPKTPAENKKPDLPQIGQKLFKARIILLFGRVTDKLAREVTAQLLAMDADNDSDPIKLIISSPGGHVESGDTIHDMLSFVAAPVLTIGTGWVASAATHIFLGVPQERRFSLPNTRFMMHQPMGGVRGPAADIDIEANEIIKMRERINRVIARETGQPFERVEKDTERNFWMSATEALEYGLVGKLIAHMHELN